MSDLAVNSSLIAASERDVTSANIQAIYDYSYPILLGALYVSPPARPDDILLNTLANRMPLIQGRRIRRRRIQDQRPRAQADRDIASDDSGSEADIRI